LRKQAGMTETRSLFVIHGSNAHITGAPANGGYPGGGAGACARAPPRAFTRECEIREFSWSGRNTHQARLDAGTALARAIAKEDAGLRIYLIGHSHGGNVALVAANNLPAGRVESVVLLANPNMVVMDSADGTSEPLYWGRAVELVRKIWNLYTPEDFVQSTLARLRYPRKDRQDSRCSRRLSGSRAR
jgi:pimeloyl-ACP methyl ester carboxylesterase